MKTIKVKPVESICIEFTDRKYICSFNMLSTAYVQEELNKLDCRIDEVAPAQMASIVLYAGIKSNHEEFTIEEARALVIKMDPSCYGEILGSYSDAMFESMSDEKKKIAKKIMAQYLLNVKM